MWCTYFIFFRYSQGSQNTCLLYTSFLKTKLHGKDCFSIGKQEVDLRYLEQLIDGEQTASLALLLKYAIEHLIDGKRTVSDICNLLVQKLETGGLSAFSENKSLPCGYAVPRIQEIYSCFNRFRRR